VDTIMAPIVSMQDLIREVTYLRDRQDILDSICGYSRGLDRHDVDILVAAYTEGAIDEHGMAINGLPEFAEWINRLHDNHFWITLHNITTHNCELDGESAHCESYVLFGLSTKDQAHVWFGGGRYVDRMQKSASGWAIAHRRTIIEWLFLGDNTLFNSKEFKAWQYPGGKKDKSDDSYLRPLELSKARQEEFAKQGRTAPEL
jgi:hypothetical protein